MKRVVLIVLDSFGVGELEDSYLFGDQNSNTFVNISKNSDLLDIPYLVELGLGNIDGLDELADEFKTNKPIGSYGKANEKFFGKDTTGGHWEIAGLILDKPFITYPNGFPQEIILEFEKQIGRKTLGNCVASGTVIIEELGQKHIETGHPIIYTSADSVFQIACHEEIIPIKEQYEICETARNILKGENLVGRVIARPFLGQKGSFYRTERRKDYSVSPPKDTMLDYIKAFGKTVYAIGKIEDIFNNKGITDIVHSTNNHAGIEAIVKAINMDFEGLIFANLVDFDMLYGHRNNVDGYAKELTRFDSRLPEIMESLKKEDVMIITADHGCDPTTKSTDHSREYIPILVYGENVKSAINIGVRESFADIGSTIMEYLDVTGKIDGQSFLNQIIK